MRRPFVTFIILVPDGRSAVEVANKAIMSLLMLAISAVGPARCMNVRASMRKHATRKKGGIVRGAWFAMSRNLYALQSLQQLSDVARHRSSSREDTGSRCARRTGKGRLT